eukprot:5679779-Lingulodinium_polyedra.AAC.1
MVGEEMGVPCAMLTGVGEENLERALPRLLRSGARDGNGLRVSSFRGAGVFREGGVLPVWPR